MVKVLLLIVARDRHAVVEHERRRFRLGRAAAEEPLTRFRAAPTNAQFPKIRQRPVVLVARTSSPSDCRQSAYNLERYANKSRRINGLVRYCEAGFRSFLSVSNYFHCCSKTPVSRRLLSASCFFHFPALYH